MRVRYTDPAIALQLATGYKPLSPGLSCTGSTCPEGGTHCTGNSSIFPWFHQPSEKSCMRRSSPGPLLPAQCDFEVEMPLMVCCERRPGLL